MPTVGQRQHDVVARCVETEPSPAPGRHRWRIGGGGGSGVGPTVGGDRSCRGDTRDAGATWSAGRHRRRM